MNTIFISTYDENIIIGLIQNGLKKDILVKESKRSHSVYLIPMIKEILEKNNMNVHLLNEIIVVNGPGSFTGIRLGVTVAKTLAYTLNIPIKTISSLEAIGASNSFSKKIVIIKDTKGCFLGKFNGDILEEELKYLTDKEYIKYMESNDYPVIDNTEFDLNRIYEYLQCKPYEKVHAVNPVYIKGIEALSGR